MLGFLFSFMFAPGERYGPVDEDGKEGKKQGREEEGRKGEREEGWKEGRKKGTEGGWKE